MTRDDIIYTALQCGLWIPMEHGPEREQTIDRVQRFAGRVAAVERDACAKVCEARQDRYEAGGFPREFTAARACAAAISARGDA